MSPPHRSETNGIAERAVIRSEWKVVCRFYGMLHLSAKRYRSLIWWEDAHMRDVLGNHLKDRLFRLVQWLSIILQLRTTSRESINLERKSYLDCSSDTLCTRVVEFGRVTYWLQTLRSWKRWTHQKSTQKDSMQKRWYFPKENGNFFQSQMDESNFLEEIRNWRIRRVSSTTSRLTSGCRWSDKWFFGPCQETSYTAITLNQESNFTRLEKIHSLFHWNRLTSPELQERIWMLCNKAASMTIGNIDGSRDLSDSWTGFSRSTQSKGRNFSRTATLRTGWKMVGWFCGMLLQSV